MPVYRQQANKPKTLEYVGEADSEMEAERLAQVGLQLLSIVKSRKRWIIVYTS